MTLTISKRTFIIFDLDDTLYKEVDFLKSAYRHIARKLENEIGKNIYKEMLQLRADKKSVLDVIIEEYQFKDSISALLFEYRYHQPDIQLSPGALRLLKLFRKNGILIGLITDGRSKSQRNKLAALGIENYFCKILISQEFGSEKPDQRNFEYFMENFDADQFIYIGDNFNKDFISPNKLGWMTIGLLDNGKNIHQQNLKADKAYLPQKTVSSLIELLQIIKFKN